MAMLAEMSEAVLELKRGCPDRIPAIYEEAVLQTRLLLHRDVDVDIWWTKQKPCALLHDGLCSVYKVRPVICRSYAVITPAENCGGADPAGHVLRVNTEPVRHFAWSRATAIHAKYGFPNLHGPLPFVLLCAFFIHVRGLDAFNDAVRGTVFGDPLSNITFWLRLEGEEKYRRRTPPELERKLFGPDGLAGLFDENGDFRGDIEMITLG
jgi:Fe-S-cluster containining protein